MSNSYGTIYTAQDDPSVDTMTDLERLATGPSRRAPGMLEKVDIAMRPLPDHGDDALSDVSNESNESAQAGVKRAEAIASTWSSGALICAYFGIGLIACATSLEAQTTGNLTIFATSSFSSHSLVATVGVVQSVVLSVAKPPMSKIADVFGRFEAFALSVLICVIGYGQQAASDSVQTYAAAQIFYAAGVTGLQILTQIFIADTSDLVNRAFCSVLPSLPFLATVWLGPELAEGILTSWGWRWGYGIWIVILPIAFMPLGLTLYINQRRAARRGLLPESQFKGQTYREAARTLWFELDVMGLFLICAAFSLILIPLTLASSTGWQNHSLTAMLAVGIACLLAFPLWERSDTLAPRAFFPRALLTNRTVLAGLGIAFFYFMAFYLSIYPYFQSYLLVVHNETVSSAGRIVQAFTFAATVCGLLVSLLIRRVKRYRAFVILGSVVYLAGLGLMLYFRNEEATTFSIVVSQLIVGTGGALVVWPTQLGVQASASHQEVAASTAIFMTVLEIGGAIGNAISGAIWNRNLPAKLKIYLPADTKDQADAIFGNVSLAASGWPMESPTRIAINRAYQETMTKILWVALIVAIPCFFLSFLMRNYKLDEIDQNVKGVVMGGVQEPADIRETEPLAGPSRRRSMSSQRPRPGRRRSSVTTSLLRKGS